MSSATNDEAGVALPGGRARIVTVAGERMLCVPAEATGLDGTLIDDSDGRRRLVRLTTDAAERMRQLVPALAPRPFGTARSSFGFGDRLGVATPGHVRALRASGTALAPVLAQQSARELERTGRSFRDVLDAATWGALASGWVSDYGADADHLRTETEVADAVASGFTMLTLDPTADVEAAAATAEGSALDALVRALPWELLEDDWQGLRRRHPADTLELARTAATYGRALARIVTLRRAAGDAAPVDLEVSVDELPVPTSAFAHRFLAIELRRLGVPLTGLAPRLPGTWRKGVEAAGDLAEIARAAIMHARIAREEGGHKVSLHSASDKLAVYPLLASTGGRWHVKTSGTSYLEALRVVAASDSTLFRDVLAVAREALTEDRRSYAIAETAGVPEPTTLADATLPTLLDDPDARQCLHVTYGSVLTDEALAARLRASLAAHAEAYADVLSTHFERHLAPLEGLA